VERRWTPLPEVVPGLARERALEVDNREVGIGEQRLDVGEERPVLVQGRRQAELSVGRSPSSSRS
jgi:hypothetical protein